MWTEITRPKYERTGQRYASDLTDREWAVIEPLMPAPKRLGRPRETDVRAVLDAILYIARSGHPADVQDRDGAGLVIRAIHDLPGCAISSPTASTTAPTCAPPSPGSASGPSRSSNAPRRRRLSAAAAPLGRRAHPCLAQSKPPLVKGFRGVLRQRDNLDLHSLDPTPHQEAVICINTTYTI